MRQLLFAAVTAAALIPLHSAASQARPDPDPRFPDGQPSGMGIR
jgi:hypothetical protein